MDHDDYIDDDEFVMNAVPTAKRSCCCPEPPAKADDAAQQQVAATNKPDLVDQDPSTLWSLRISRADHHNILLALRVFPDATIWEVKVLLAGVTKVPPQEMVLQVGREVLTGGILKELSRKGVKNYCTMIMSRRADIVRLKHHQDRVGGGSSTDPIALHRVLPQAVLTKKEHTLLVNQLPRRKYMSSDLFQSIQRLAKSNTDGSLDPDALKELTNRLENGENVESIDYRSGMTPLQLSLYCGTVPGLGVILMRLFNAKATTEVSLDFEPWIPQSQRRVADEHGVGSQTSVPVSPTATATATATVLSPTTISSPTTFDWMGQHGQDILDGAPRGIESLPLILACQRFENFSIIPKLVEATSHVQLRNPRVLERLRHARYVATKNAERVRLALGVTAPPEEDERVQEIVACIAQIEALQNLNE